MIPQLLSCLHLADHCHSHGDWRSALQGSGFVFMASCRLEIYIAGGLVVCVHEIMQIRDLCCRVVFFSCGHEVVEIADLRCRVVALCSRDRGFVSWPQWLVHKCTSPPKISGDHRLSYGVRALSTASLLL